MSEFDIDDIERRMKGAVDALKHEFSGLLYSYPPRSLNGD